MSEQEQDQKIKKRKRRRLLGCLIIFGGIILIFFTLLLIATAFAAAAVFDKKPLRPEAVQISNQAFMQATIKLRQLAIEMNECPPNETRTLSLTPDEVNAIISMTEKAQIFLAMFSIAKINPQEIQQIKDYTIRYKGGWFILYYSKKLDFTTPFGEYLNAKTVFAPYIKGKKRGLDIESLQLGAIPVPQSVARAEIDYFVNIAETEEDYKKCLSIVDEFQIDTADNVIIRYYPARLKEVLGEFMKKK